MKTLLNHPLSQGCVIIILITIGFLIGRAYDPLLVLPERDRCAICDAESREVPCLLNTVTGEIGELAGASCPGLFQYLLCGELVGAWDSDAQTGWLTLSPNKKKINPFFFCRSCRSLLSERILGSHAVLDLSDPEAPCVYPPMPGASYRILNYVVSVRCDDDEVLLQTSLSQ